MSNQKTNQLILKVVGANNRELEAILNLVDIQKMANEHGEDAVKNSIYGIFKGVNSIFKR